VAGIGAVALFVASGRLGLRILDVAAATFNVRPEEAVATILLRTVTIALFEAATFAAGWYALLIGLAGWRTRCLPRSFSAVGLVLGALHILDFVLPGEVRLIAPLATIPWSLWLAGVLWRERPASEPAVAAPVSPGYSG
jgi:hypothetical protein